jgi:hypothetical protein
MKGKLFFDLDDHGDRLAHKRALNSTNAYIAFSSIDNMLRKYTKYLKDISPGDKVAFPDGYHTITETESQLMHFLAQQIRGKINETMQVHDINLDDLE